MKLADLNDPKYIAFESYKKNGNAVNTPLWVYEEDGGLRAWTASSSWKVKRVRNNSQVRVATSDAKGVPKGEWIHGVAQVLDSAADEEEARKRLAKKYGLSYWMIRVFTWFAQRGRTNVVIEIRDPS